MEPTVLTKTGFVGTNFCFFQMYCKLCKSEIFTWEQQIRTYFFYCRKTLIRDSLAAADWCRKATFDGGLKLPAVLSMDREEKKKALQEMDTWNGELDEGSPAELFTFLFKKKKQDYCAELVDKKNLQTFCKI